MFTSLFRQAPARRLNERYVLLETIATGQLGAVYRARDTLAEVTVAIKELPTTALFRSDERRTATSALQTAIDRWQALTHPSLTGVMASFLDHDRYYVVLEYIDGPSLATLVSQYGKFSEDLARKWGAQLGALLTYLHSQIPAIYAPFLAPHHVLIDIKGRLKLADYGFSALVAAGLYGPYGSIRGYAAPELADTSPTISSDVFALGRLLYALLTGQLLEQRQVRHGSLRQLAPGISDQLVRVVAQAAHRDPQKRYASAHDVVLDLIGTREDSVEPVADWRAQLGHTLQQSSSDTRRRPAPALPASPDDDLMAQAGFERDPRFGPNPMGAASRHASEAPTATTAPAIEQKPAITPRLSIHPQQINLTNLQTPGTLRAILTLRNTGDTDLVGSIASRVDWIRAPAKPISLAPGKQAKVVLSLRAEKLPAGGFTEPQALVIDSNAGRHWVAVSADAPEGPRLLIGKPILEFGAFQDDSERILSLLIENLGRQTLTGKVVSRVPWLQPLKANVRCAAGETATVSVRLLPGGLPPGPQRVESALIIDSDGGQAHIAAAAHRLVPALELGATHIDLGQVPGGEVADRYLYVGNTGDGLLQGSVRSLVPWLQAFPQEVTCAPGELAQITVSVDTAGLADGPLELPQALRIQTNGGARTLSLRAQISAPRLILPSRHLVFGTVSLGESKRIGFVLRNEGTAPLEARLQSLVSWLSVEPDQIACPAGAQVVVSVTADTSVFARGQHLQLPALRLVAGNSLVEIPAAIAIIHPALSVEPSTIDFGYADPAQPETRTLTIANEGTGSLAWHAQTDAQWVEVQPQSGRCEMGATATLTLTAYALAIDTRQGSSAGGNLIIASDGGRAKIPLRIALATPMLAVDTTLLNLETSINRQTVSGSFRIFNHGLGILQGTLAVDEPWLVLDRASFACETGHSIEVHVATDMEELSAGVSTATGLIRVASNGGDASISVALSIHLAAHIEPPEALHLAPSETGLVGRLTLRNTGMAVAHVTLQSSDPSLELTRTSCDVKPQKSVRIVAHWATDSMPLEPLSVAISYDSHPSVHVPVTVDS
ncbi:MAG: protein kinase domain-containing protein [Anaerolineae bacterium]